MKNTMCKDCYFADTASSDKPCFFDIPNIVRNSNKIEVIDNYNKINNYICRYGFSKKIYQENIDKLHNVDMIEYIKQSNIVKYSLALVIKNSEAENIYQKIHQLSILPYYITIICYKDAQQLHSLLQSPQNYIKYKIHKFLEEIPASHALHIALETNKAKIGNLLWILDENGLDKVLEQDSIQNINYTINVLQTPAHYYKNKNIDSQFNGIFINTNNYWNLSRTHNYEIENNEHTLVVSYD
jgi:hypothetical protein